MRPEVARELAALRARIDLLTRESEGPDDGPAPAGELDVLVCRCAGVRVGLLLSEVEVVVLVPATVPLPEASPWVVGLLDLHGEVLPVLDLAARIEQREARVAVSDHVVICRLDGRGVGLLVPSVEGLVRVARRADPPEVPVPHAWYVREALEHADGVVLRLGLRRLLSLTELPSPPEPAGGARP